MALASPFTALLEGMIGRTVFGALDPWHPADVALQQTGGMPHSFGITNVDGVQVYCSTPGNMATCQRVNAPSPKRAPQRTTTVNSPAPAPAVSAITPVRSAMGGQYAFPEMVSAHELNLPTLVQQRTSAGTTRTLDSRAFAGNPFNFLFR